MEGDGRGSPEAERADDAVAVGTRIGRYEIVRRIGAGGMGVVVAARDHELDRMVALKLLRSPDQEDAAARLAREGKALAKLTHPNVVTVYDIGHHADELFIAMELIDGETLRTWLKTPRSWREVLRAFLEAARGLAAAHRAGLVHRDFKPDNVLIDRAGHARVTDFGLARAMRVDDSAPGSPSRAPDAITRSGALAGTPAYMAPEQLLGRPVDARADQWSFAVSLFEALSGKRPFGRKVAPDVNPVAAIVADVTSGRQPTPPGPRWLGRIVRRCLEVDPARRYPSMDAVARALERGLGRRRRMIAAVGGAAIVAGVATAFALRAAVVPPKQWAPILLAHEWPRTISGDGMTVVIAPFTDDHPTEIWTERRGGGGRRTYPMPEGVEAIGQIAASHHAERAFVLLRRAGRGEIWEIDLATGKVTERWAAGESRTLATKYPLVDVAPDGATLVVTVNENPDGGTRLWRLDASGHNRVVGDAMEMIGGARWSPDGRLIARVGVWPPDTRVDILDADSGRVLETLPGGCAGLNWLNSRSLTCVREEGPRNVVYEVPLEGAGEPRPLYSGPPYQTVTDLRITQDGALLATLDRRQNLHVLEISSRSLTPVAADTLMDTHGSWTSDGTLIFGGLVWGRFKLHARRLDGSTGPIQEAATAEIPLCVLGDVIVYGRFPDGEMSFPLGPPRAAKGEVALFRRTLASAPVALGTSKGFIDLVCAGDRAPPCYLVEREDEAKLDSSRGGTLHRLVEWSPETGTRGRTVLRWLAHTGWGLPALSPDGRLLARPRKDGRIDLQPIDGGAPTTLPCDGCQGPKYPTWDLDGNLVTNGYPENRTLARVRPDGSFEVLMKTDGTAFKEPRVSPDGKTIAVLATGGSIATWWVPAEDMR